MSSRSGDVQVVVLNGASSSGKSSIARALQARLAPEPWLTYGVDTFIDGLPDWLGGDDGGFDVAADGTIAVGPAFGPLQDAWFAGLAAMARAGARLVLDDVFLRGGRSQAELAAALDGLAVAWVGVRCDPAEAARRERARGDRVPGQAAHQAAIVHEGVRYDVEVDTTARSPEDVADRVAAHLADRR